jgi:host cell factor
MPRWEEIIPRTENHEPYGRSLHSASIIGDKMIVFGGWDASSHKGHWHSDNCVWILHLKTKTWERRPNGGPNEKPFGRAGHGAAMVSLKPR